MGKLHFEQMYSEASAIDRRALAFLPILMARDVDDVRVYSKCYWDSSTFDGAVEICRKLSQLEDDYYDTLKLKLVERKLEAYGVCATTHRLVAINDPDVIDFDIDTMTDELFEALLTSEAIRSAPGT